MNTIHKLVPSQEEKLPSEVFNVVRTPSLFVSKPANQWMIESSLRPNPKHLFDELWFEDELCFLFSDSNAGKSVLGVQIADSITSGIPVPGFVMDATPEPTLYFDLELSDKQFECRYSNDYSDHYRFDPRFVRAELCPSDDLECTTDYDVLFLEEIEAEIQRSEARRMILDNITFASDETEKSKSALRIMKGLKALKSRYGLSILALGHTPKRPPDRPLSQNDLAGSKMLINFADAAFAIGRSVLGPQTRYLKQIKVRSAPDQYGAGNVISCELEKPTNFLRFARTESGPEREHLSERSENQSQELEISILELHHTNPELSQREIADRLRTNASKVNRVLNASPK